MMWLLDLLGRIPSAFWGVVAGSVFTLTAVILTNRANDRRARAQFQHDQDLRTKERELVLKKDIYLSATEAISAGLRAVAALSNLDLAYDQLMQPYVDKSTAIAKVHIIGNEETLKAVATISSELQGTFMRLIIKRIPLTQMKQRIIIPSQQIANFEKERDRILELIKDHNIEGSPDQRRFKVLQGNFEFNQKHVLEGIKERNKLESTLRREQLSYAEE